MKRVMAFATACIVATGVLAASATAAEASSAMSITVCAHGNYTAYAKVAAADNSFSASGTHAPAGTCTTSAFVINSNKALNLYLFGIYNVSHKGFDVCRSGGAVIGGDPQSPLLQNVALYAAGTTTAPYWENDPAPFGC